MHDIEILKEMDHPNILKLYEFYDEKKRYYVVTELCTGGELYYEITSKQFFNEKEVLHISKQICGVLAYCHNKGIVHRDLKPENILFDSKNGNIIKIMDFGLSAYLEDGKIPRETVGTSYYIAPEVLQSDYDEKCDMWSLGVILFIMLSGRAPFDGRNDREIIKNILSINYDVQIP